MSSNVTSYPTLGVGAVVWKDDKVLLIKRGKAPMKGSWSLPGGHVEFGETVRDAILREVAEETGLEVKVTRLIDVVDAFIPDADGGIEKHFALVDFRCDWLSGEAVAASDAADCQWVTLKECEALISWSETLRIIRESR